MRLIFINMKDLKQKKIVFKFFVLNPIGLDEEKTPIIRPEDYIWSDEDIWEEYL